LTSSRRRGFGAALVGERWMLGGKESSGMRVIR